MRSTTRLDAELILGAVSEEWAREDFYENEDAFRLAEQEVQKLRVDDVTKIRTLEMLDFHMHMTRVLEQDRFLSCGCEDEEQCEYHRAETLYEVRANGE